MQIALIDKITNIVDNIIEVSDSSQWSPPEGFFMVFSKEAKQGDIFDGSGFVNPPVSVLSQIIEIENTITQRRLREAILGIDNAWLATKDSEISQLREQL